MKKLISIFLSMTLVAALLAGCGHTHTWVDATCTSPKTCSDCGETEGEPLTHLWTDATCTTPKTCTVCGTQDGDTLEHTLMPANFQSASICSVCGMSVGDKLPALFEEKGYSLISADTEYDYHSITQNTNIPIVGKVSVSDYRVTASEDQLEVRDGYEWRIANVNYTFSGDDASRDGYKFAIKVMDYYLGLQDPDFDNEKTVHYLDEQDKTVEDKNFIDYNGEIYERANTKYTELQNGWINDVAHITLEVAVQVPVGYDGIVLCVYNSGAGSSDTLESLEGANPLFFRMN